MDLGMSGNVALVIGGTDGIGLATAVRLAREGCTVAVVGRDSARGLAAVAAVDAAAGQTSGTTTYIGADLAKAGAAADCVATVESSLGPIDILVASVGSVPVGTWLQADENSWQYGFASKPLGYVAALRAVLPSMCRRRRGAVVLVAGNGAHQPRTWEVAPGAMNAAVVNLCQGISGTVGNFGVRINSVSPGPVATRRWEMAEQALSDAKGLTADEARRAVRASIPRGEIGSPDEVGAVIAFLCSPLAGYVNGTDIVVDGGQRTAVMEGFLAGSPPSGDPWDRNDNSQLLTVNNPVLG